MCTIPPRFTSARILVLLALVALLGLPAIPHAQAAGEDRAGKSPSRTSTRINWPRTFGGQPDFEFTRQDVVNELTQESTKQGLPAPTVPTLADLLEDTTLSPLMLEEVPASTPSATTTTSGTEVTSGTLPATSGQDILPAMQLGDTINLAEFRTLLTNALAQQVRTFRLGDEMDASYLLRQLKLQTVVRSPIAYATINETRYSVGDTLTLPLMAGPSDSAQLALLQSLLPPEGSLTPEVAAQYQAALEEVIKQLALEKNTNQAKFQKVFDLPVTLMEIQPRTVIVQFQGQKHELKIPYLY